MVAIAETTVILTVAVVEIVYKKAMTSWVSLSPFCFSSYLSYVQGNHNRPQSRNPRSKLAPFIIFPLPLPAILEVPY